LGAASGANIRIEAVYLNLVQAASRAGVRHFATREWAGLTPELLTDSLALVEGLAEGASLGQAFPATFPFPSFAVSVAAPVAAAASMSAAPVAEPASSFAEPDSPIVPAGPSPSPTPAPTPAPTVSREPSSNSGVVESARAEPEPRGRGAARHVVPLPKRSTRKRVASQISRSPDVARSAPSGGAKGKGTVRSRGHAVSLFLFTCPFALRANAPAVRPVQEVAQAVRLR
jgi:hypothetical protein